MQQILLFGAGKSATSLIRYLIVLAAGRGWRLTVAENNLPLAQSKIGDAACARAVAISVEDEPARDRLVAEAQLVISLLPPALHYLVAVSCLKAGRHLLTASYIDDAIRSMKSDIDRSGRLFLCEMGLDPGIDHMSALHFIDVVRTRGEQPVSFYSHTGGLIAPESDDNPWHYKISWNPRNVVRAGAAGAKFLENGQVVERSYAGLFENPGRVAISGIGELAWYPNRDSLPYIAMYGLQAVSSFVRTTLRYPVFCMGWATIVRAGLTDDQQPLERDRRHSGSGLTVAEWAAPVGAFLQDGNRRLFEYLGFFDRREIPATARTNADVLQWVLETKIAMQPQDRDMIVMKHEIGCLSGTRFTSTLVVKGEDALHTAMAKTVGLPLGIAAKLLMEGKLRIRGLQIPTAPELYGPVLEELEREGVRFVEN